MDSCGLEFLEKGAFEISRMGESPLFAAKESDAAMAKLEKSPGGGVHGRGFVGAGGGNGNSASPTEESKGGK